MLVLPCVQNVPGKLARQLLLATPKGKRSRGHPRLMWRDYISDRAWCRIGAELAKPPYMKLLKVVKNFSSS